jgi:hypothetical protein
VQQGVAPQRGNVLKCSWLYAGNSEHPVVLVQVECDTPVVSRPTWAVTTHPVRTISRKGQVPRSGSSALSTVRGFSISVVRNATCALGWQVQHEFAVTQASPSRSALEYVQNVLGCGRIVEQTRHDNRRASLLRFSVKRRADLMGIVVPFFTERPLRTAKRLDFERFVTALQMMEDGRHRTKEGLALIASITESMNRQQRSRYLESSEAIRQPSRSDSEMKIWS